MTSMPHSPQAAKHKRFYFKNEKLIKIQIEDTIFQVHRHFFEKHSPVFAAMFTLPDAPTLSDVTKSKNLASYTLDREVLQIPSVTIPQFESLLKFFYDSQIDALSYAEWLDVLAIAHRFEMLEIFGRATDEVINPTTPQAALQLLGLPVVADIPNAKLVSALCQIVDRAEPLTAEEIRILGSTFSACIARAREYNLKARCPAHKRKSPGSARALVAEGLGITVAEEGTAGKRARVITLDDDDDDYMIEHFY